MRIPGTKFRAILAKMAATRGEACWLWRGSKSPDGYGFVSWLGYTRKPHRVAYELAHGPIPDGIQIDHLCKTKLCFNPSHLEAVTQSENLRRRWAAYAPETCKYGHAWTPENTKYIRLTGRKARSCRKCQVRRTTEYRRRKAKAKRDHG